MVRTARVVIERRERSTSAGLMLATAVAHNFVGTLVISLPGPSSTEIMSPILAVTLAGGVAAMLLADKLIDRLRGEPDVEHIVAPPGSTERVRIPFSLIAAVAIDFLLDGLLLGVGFAAGARIGILLAVAEAAEPLSVGLALAGELRAARLSLPRILLLVASLGSLVFVTAVAGATVLGG